MIPLLTIVFGPSQANLFKIAKMMDGALLFHRTVIKTIGITDTALLLHVQQLAQAKKLMPIAFTKIMTGLVALCLPLSGILLFAVAFHHKVFGDECAFQLFFILMIGYLIETILVTI